MPLLLSRAAARTLHRLARSDSREHVRICRQLAEIEADPTGRHSTALVHLGGRRSRCGAWRLLYELGDPIRVRSISHRRNAYAEKG
ncbi:hypothetical protein AB0N09_05600 [Streptomyces erythrochromogenes]|uniref:type II toxin-antitoxin system RelE family toxin n=1 Tax=Streptomyces erythrochromogenes TaxID=285574 RepID=UPI00343F8F2D